MQVINLQTPTGSICQKITPQIQNQIIVKYLKYFKYRTKSIKQDLRHNVVSMILIYILLMYICRTVYKKYDTPNFLHIQHLYAHTYTDHLSCKNKILIPDGALHIQRLCEICAHKVCIKFIFKPINNVFSQERMYKFLHLSKRK